MLSALSMFLEIRYPEGDPPFIAGKTPRLSPVGKHCFVLSVAFLLPGKSPLAPSAAHRSRRWEPEGYRLPAAQL